MSTTDFRQPSTETNAERDVDAALRRLTDVLEKLDSLVVRADTDRSALRHAVGSQPAIVADDVPGLCAGLVVVPSQVTTAAGREAWPAPLVRAAASYGRVRPFLEHAPFLREKVAELAERLRRSGRRRLLGKGDPDAWSAAAAEVVGLEHWAAKTGFASALYAAVHQTGGTVADPASGDLVAVLAQVLGLPDPQGQSLLGSDDADLLGDAAERGGELIAFRDDLVTDVADTFAQIQERMVQRRLQDVSLEALREASGGQFRVRPLEEAGIENVQDVLDDPQVLHRLPGLGAQAVNAAHSAALDLRRRVEEDLRLRIDLDERDALLTHLVDGLAAVLAFDAALDDHRYELEDLVRTLTPLRGALVDKGGVLLLHRHSPRRGSDVARHLRERARWLRATGLGEALRRDPAAGSGTTRGWDDFKKRPIIYHGLLGEIVGLEQDGVSMQGHLSQEIVAAVEKQRLDTSALSADLQSSLRAYQSFGARYALVQRRVLIGDEMGLGKTIQALAVMSHLAQQGRSHVVVVCPTAVIVNWIREIRRHSALRSWRAHGPRGERDRALRGWEREGGILVTSHTTLSRLDIAVDPDLLVVDEAHFVKNPETQRAVAVREVGDRSERALFLTGTPLENKVEDFVNLVTQLQREVLDDVDAAGMVLGARSFREAVAPVYLRRNAKDVLSELPDLVLNEDWLELTTSENDAYIDAVADGQFHQARQVAFLADPDRSRKLDRIEEIVDEANSNGLRVVIFSYYLDVLAEVRRRLGGRVVGVITGSTAADDRQALVDEFGATRRAGVLAGQIGAAGTGLNIQAASVVIMCEPQVKPSLEDQAVKRAHRMGQVNTVQVHRLFTIDSIDERMLELLAFKSALFETFAASSDVAQASPEATDMSESRLRQEVLAKEQQRLAESIRGRQPRRPEADTPNAETVSSAAAATPESSQRKRLAGASKKPMPISAATKPTGDANPFTRPERPEATPTRRAQICGSCGSPIDVLGHCRCS